MEVGYANNLSVAETGIVYTVIHNSVGQTVSMQTTTITPGAGQALTAFFVVSMFLSSGTYKATVFVVTTGGVSISSTSTFVFTLR
jgi:hypothetical protein